MQWALLCLLLVACVASGKFLSLMYLFIYIIALTLHVPWCYILLVCVNYLCHTQMCQQVMLLYA